MIPGIERTYFKDVEIEISSLYKTFFDSLGRQANNVLNNDNDISRNDR